MFYNCIIYDLYKFKYIFCYISHIILKLNIMLNKFFVKIIIYTIILHIFFPFLLTKLHDYIVQYTSYNFNLLKFFTFYIVS